MTNSRVRHLLVIDDGELAGIVSMGDIVKLRLEDLETETNVSAGRILGGALKSRTSFIIVQRPERPPQNYPARPSRPVQRISVQSPQG